MDLCFKYPDIYLVNERPEAEMLRGYEQQHEDEDGGGGLGHSTVQYSTV